MERRQLVIICDSDIMPGRDSYGAGRGQLYWVQPVVCLIYAACHSSGIGIFIPFCIRCPDMFSWVSIPARQKFTTR